MADLNPAQARAGFDDGRAAKTDHRVGVGGFLGGHVFRLDGNEQHVRGDALQFEQPRGHQIGDDDPLRLGPAGRAFRGRRTFIDGEVLEQIGRRDAAQEFIVDELRLRLAVARLDPGPRFMPGHVEGFEDVLEFLVRRDPLFHLVAQFDEIALLLAQDFLAGQWAVTWADKLHVQLHGLIQDANP